MDEVVAEGLEVFVKGEEENVVEGVVVVDEADVFCGFFFGSDPGDDTSVGALFGPSGFYDGLEGSSDCGSTDFEFFDELSFGWEEMSGGVGAILDSVADEIGNFLISLARGRASSFGCHRGSIQWILVNVYKMFLFGL